MPYRYGKGTMKFQYMPLREMLLCVTNFSRTLDIKNVMGRASRDPDFQQQSEFKISLNERASRAGNDYSF